MAKKHRIHPQGSRYIREAVPSPREVAAFVAPRTMEDGLSIANIFGDAAEMTPFAGAVPYAERELGLRDYSDEDVLLSAIMGFPILGKFRNLKEAWGPHRWSNAKWHWKNNTNKAPKLFANPEQLRYNGPTEHAISTRARTNASANANSPVVTPAGPYIRTNTGTDIVGTGRQAMNTNTISRNQARAQTTNLGKQGWQGEMYPPGRTLRMDDTYGPFPWESKYSHKLDKTLERNELDWEYLINETRTPPAGNRNADRMTKLSKEEVANIAIEQGRPDIAERVMQDDKPRIMPSEQPIFRTIKSNNKTAGLDNKDWKDLGNRRVEKEIREVFATLPKDHTIRQQFAEYYGVPDLYQSWSNDPLIWDKYTNDVLKARTNRERSNASYDRILGRSIER